MSSGFGESTKSASSSEENSSIIDAGDFNCSICFDFVQEPVVTLCGHLFCWRCLYRWLHHRSRPKGCPVCKAVVEEEKLVPLYGKGKSVTDDPRLKSYLGMEIPPRPFGQRPQTVEVHEDDDEDDEEEDDDDDDDDDDDEEEDEVEFVQAEVLVEEEEVVEEEEEEAEDPDYVAAPDTPFLLRARLESSEQRFKEYRESTEQRFNEYNEFINEFKEFRDEYREFREALQPRLEQIEQRIKDINECRVEAEQRIEQCRAEAEQRIEQCRAEAEQRIKECRAEYGADTE
ncbi:uncharacterized protein LOC131646819 [Vicia villosa]|uniref:uncharacterized protein LOC131646819 n=1 Tax=Vicia villosa TaxID=3911 RepID=UPI00273BE406|nr:uncharacterized protein LOC131646819 [Vicia villosa]